MHIYVCIYAHNLCKIVTNLMYNKLCNVHFGIHYTNFYTIIIEHILIT